MHTILQHYHGKIVESGICGKQLLSIWTVFFALFVCGRKTGFPVITGGLFSAYLYSFTVQKKEGCEEKEKLFLPDFTALDLL